RFAPYLTDKETYQQAGKSLLIKEVKIEGGRYVICYHEEEAKKEAVRREQLVESLKKKLEAGSPKQLIGNKGYRSYLKMEKQALKIDQQKVKEEAQWDGIFVLKTNSKLPSEEVCVRYKELWQVEHLFRQSKSILETRPIFHKYDETIKGHVFCSFLALVVMKELMLRNQYKLEWQQMRQDLDALYETKIAVDGKSYWIRSPLQGVANTVFRTSGIAIPPTIREA
ncbi:MAG: IS1634 family transposase, partial [Chitinophagaceae bacterium]